MSAGHIAVTAPGGALTNDIALYQSGPGEYQFRVQAPAPGAYQIAIDLPGAEPLHEISGFTIPSSPELRPDPNGSALMQAIASRTGGRSLTLDDASSVFDAPGAPGTALRTYRAVWFVPLAAALVLLLVELAIRLAFLDRLRGLRHGR